MTDLIGNPRLLDIPEEDRKLLKERAREIAKRPESAELTDGLEALELHSRGQNYAIPLSAISSITELSSIAAIPRAPSAVRGLVSVRGEVLLAVELALLTGGAGSGIADLRRVVVVGVDSLRLAILAERIISVRQVQAGNFRADRMSQFPFVVGTDENFLSLVDPAALINFAFRQLGGAT
ncbi:MAG: chemotaxis protein CheW [Myxococcaceae bacterium]